MRKLILTAVMLSSVAVLVPLTAQANHCNHVYFFSRPVAPVEHNGVGCLADGTEDTDARFFVPGSTGFTVRYVQPVDTEPDFYWIDLEGSLFPTSQRVKAPKITLADGVSVAYETATVNFPGGRSAAGCVTATVEVEEDDLATNTYRTLGSTC